MGLTYQMKMKIPFDMADMNGHIKTTRRYLVESSL